MLKALSLKGVGCETVGKPDSLKKGVAGWDFHWLSKPETLKRRTLNETLHRLQLRNDVGWKTVKLKRRSGLGNPKR